MDESEISTLSDRELKAGYWYLRHKAGMHRLFVLLCILLNGALWGSVVLQGAVYFFSERDATTRFAATLERRLVDTGGVPRVADFSVADVQVLNAGGGQYDFVARLTNPNPLHRASFTYSFIHDRGVTDVRIGYILPGSGMILHALGTELAGNPGQAQLVVDNVRWHLEAGWEGAERERLSFTVSDIRATPLSTGQGLEVRYTLANPSAFGYRSLDVPLLLLRGTKVVGVNAVTLDDVRAGTVRPVVVQWFDAPTNTTSVSVHPQVNIFDPKVYMRVSAGAGSVGR